MDANRIKTDGFSNEESRKLYEQGWPAESHLKRQYELGSQCGGCSFFAPLNADWGLCCHAASRHFRETVFEHFTCASYVSEGWGPHSFSTLPEDHCRCEGQEPAALGRVVRIDTSPIRDWETFHRAFAQALGFPDFYGKNMDAWIDCMSSIGDPQAGMTSIHIPPGGVLVLYLEHMQDFGIRCPEQLRQLQECVCFVNERIGSAPGRSQLAIAG